MPITNLPDTEGAFFSITQTCPLPSLPSTSLEDSNFPEQNGGGRNFHQSESLVTGRSDEEKIPVQSKLEESKDLCFNLLWFVLSIKVAMLTVALKIVSVFYIIL